MKNKLLTGVLATLVITASALATCMANARGPDPGGGNASTVTFTATTDTGQFTITATDDSAGTQFTAFMETGAANMNVNPTINVCSVLRNTSGGNTTFTSASANWNAFENDVGNTTSTATTACEATNPEITAFASSDCRLGSNYAIGNLVAAMTMTG